MFNNRVARSLAITTALIALAGCGTQANLPTAKANLSKVVSAKAKTPAVNVITGEGHVAVPADSATVNLEFSLEADGSVRSLQAVNDIEVAAAPAAAVAPATFAQQIDHVDFVVGYEGGNKPLTYTVSKAQFLNGKAVVQFNNLPAGHLTVNASAKDAAGKQLVTATGEGDIKVGELTLVKLKCLVPTAPGVGHVRLEMDCWNEGCGPVPTPIPTGFVPNPIKFVEFHSTGDPHEEGANQLKFENQLSGTFLAMQTLTHDFVLLKNQDRDPLGRWKGTTVNNAVSVKSGGDVFAYYLYGHRARLNGKAVKISQGESLKTPGGLSVTRVSSLDSGTVFRITTPQGDEVRVFDAGAYINIEGSIGHDRVVYEVTGELGTFNNGTPEMALMLRDGTKAANLDAFLNNWVATKDENFFPAGETFTPKDYDGSVLAPGKPTN
ncbi:MAG: hypothetical protein JWM80_1605 [Cyanobacteria bacterium RYN_339]|nr:hypothetical protein [Cyanobacteria bacterium RYN_339]